MPDHAALCNSFTRKTFPAGNARSPQEFPRGNLFAAFLFDALQPEKGTAAARNKDFLSLDVERPGRRAALLIRHRLSPQVADLSAKPAVRSRPRRESPHSVENLLRRLRPVDFSVFSLQDRRQRGRRMILCMRRDAALAQSQQ